MVKILVSIQCYVPMRALFIINLFHWDFLKSLKTSCSVWSRNWFYNLQIRNILSLVSVKQSKDSMKKLAKKWKKNNKQTNNDNKKKDWRHSVKEEQYLQSFPGKY